MTNQKREGEMKNPTPSTGKPPNSTDQGAAECGERSDEVKSKGNITINIDDAQLDQTSENQTTEIKGDHNAKNL